MTVIPATSVLTTPATTPTTSSGNATQSAQDSLSSNFSTFLTLLTTQLQNQDPLSPMDSSQFTQQLVMFSQVEQQINSNENLQSLISLTQAHNSSDAVSYLGKTLTMTDGTGALINGQSEWVYSLANDSASTSLMVKDSKGDVVYTGSGETTAGGHAFTWNGQNNAGTQLPDGAYTLTVNATGGDGSTVSTAVASQGVVSEVDLTGTEPNLMIGPVSIPLSKATLISGTSTSSASN